MSPQSEQWTESAAAKVRQLASSYGISPPAIAELERVMRILSGGEEPGGEKAEVPAAPAAAAP